MKKLLSAFLYSIIFCMGFSSAVVNAGEHEEPFIGPKTKLDKIREIKRANIKRVEAAQKLTEEQKAVEITRNEIQEKAARIKRHQEQQENKDKLTDKNKKSKEAAQEAAYNKLVKELETGDEQDLTNAQQQAEQLNQHKIRLDAENQAAAAKSPEATTWKSTSEQQGRINADKLKTDRQKKAEQEKIANETFLDTIKRHFTRITGHISDLYDKHLSKHVGKITQGISNLYDKHFNKNNTVISSDLEIPLLNKGGSSEENTVNTYNWDQVNWKPFNNVVVKNRVINGINLNNL